MAPTVRSSNKSFGTLLVAVAVIGVVVLGYVVSRPAKVITLDPTSDRKSVV